MTEIDKITLIYNILTNSNSQSAYASKDKIIKAMTTMRLLNEYVSNELILNTQIGSYSQFNSHSTHTVSPFIVGNAPHNNGFRFGEKPQIPKYDNEPKRFSFGEPKTKVPCSKYHFDSCGDDDCPYKQKLVSNLPKHPCTETHTGDCDNDNCPYKLVNVKTDSKPCGYYHFGECNIDGNCHNKQNNGFFKGFDN